MKFEVGDKVRVLDGSNIEGYAGVWIPAAMKRYVGKVGTIKEVCAGFTGKEGYTLDGFGEPMRYIFDGRGLERVTKHPRRIIIEEKHGKVTARLENNKVAVEAGSLEDGAKIALGKLLDGLLCEFKVGDVVEGTSEGRYAITKKGWIGRVTDICGDGFMEVRGSNGEGFGNFEVEAKYFKLKVPRD